MTYIIYPSIYPLCRSVLVGTQVWSDPPAAVPDSLMKSFIDNLWTTEHKLSTEGRKQPQDAGPNKHKLLTRDRSRSGLRVEAASKAALKGLSLTQVLDRRTGSRNKLPWLKYRLRTSNR